MKESTSPPYPVIGDYAVIGDCRTAALISRSGSLDWLCLPHFSGPAFFAALLDRQRGGCFAVTPVGRFEVTRRYIGESNVLETTFTTATGSFRLIDCFPIPERDEQRKFLQPQREVLRIVEGTAGEIDVGIRFEPRPGYGRYTMALARRGALGWGCARGTEVLHLHSDLPLALAAGDTALAGKVTLHAGDRRYLSLTYEDKGMAVILPLGRAADGRLAATLHWWRAWSGMCRYEGPYRDAVIRSALVLKACTFAPSGAVVAAPTTSLPEAIGGVRNWDYRFCWLRDAALTFRAFFDLGHRAEGAAFLEWLLHATALTQPALQVVYDVYGRTHLREEVLDHLEGYRGSRPVRIGNAATDQLQLDVYGAVVLAVHAYIERGGRLNRREAKLLTGIGRIICRQWREPDQSIWEMRGEGRRHTYSAFMCWLALDRLLALHAQGHLRVPEPWFRREQAAIRQAIETRAFNAERGSYVDVFDGEEVDASLLLMTCYGYHAADEPRVVATYDRIQRELGRNGLLLRYRHDYDGLPGREGAFGLCSFWAVENLAARGRLDEAERMFECLLGYANDLGLFGEEIDVDSGEALGNFPQAFTHIGVITAAVALENARAGRRVMPL